MTNLTTTKWNWKALLLFIAFSWGVCVVHAQEEYPIYIEETAPDGTIAYRSEMRTVQQSEPMATRAVDAADDLQEFINNAATQTRATAADTIVVDLSSFSATTRNSTLTISTGRIYAFRNGTLKRGSSLGSNPIVKISDNSTVVLESTVSISGENISTYPAVEVYSATLRTYGRIENLRESANSTTSGYAVYTYQGAIADIASYVEGLNSTSADCTINLQNNAKVSTISTCSAINYYGTTSSDSDTPYIYWIFIHSTSFQLNVLNNIYNKIYLDLRYYTPEDKQVLAEKMVMLSEVPEYLPTRTSVLTEPFTTSDIENVILYPLNTYTKEVSSNGNQILLRIPGSQTLQEYIDALPDDTTAQVINLDDYETITEPITIPCLREVIFTGTKTPVIGASFSGSYLFKTEEFARLTYNAPGISWESGATLPDTMFYATVASYIIVNGNGTQQIAFPGTIFAIDGNITSNADIGGNRIAVAKYGSLKLNKPISSLDTYIKELYADQSTQIDINGLVVFDKVTSKGDVTWSYSGTIKTPSVLSMGSSTRMVFNVTGVNFSGTTLQFADGNMPYDTEVMRFKSLSNLAGSLSSVAVDFPKSTYSLYAYTDQSDGVLTFEAVDEAALIALSVQIDTCQALCSGGAMDLDTLYYKVLDSELSTEQKNGYITQINNLYASLMLCRASENDVQTSLNIFYGAKSVANIQSVQAALEVQLEDVLAQIASLSAEVEAAIDALNHSTPENQDDLQAFIDGLGGGDSTGGTEENPALVDIPMDEDFEIDSLYVDKYIIIRCGCGGHDHSGHNGRILIRPRPGKPGFVVGPGGHVTFRDIEISGGGGGGSNPSSTLIEVTGDVTVDSTVTFTNVDTLVYIIHVKDGGTVQWRGEAPQGKVKNEGDFYHQSGTIQMYYNHGYTEVSGGHTHYLFNYKEYRLIDGVIGQTDNIYKPTIENHGTMHLTGGRVTGGRTLIVHYRYSVLYIDGCHLDDSCCETTIEAYDDFYTRGENPYRLVRLDPQVRVHFITEWKVIWHIVFVNEVTPCRHVIFVDDDRRLSKDHAKWIEYELPNRYRWYYNAEDNGLEIRDDKVYDEDDLQNFIDGLDGDNGTDDEPRVLDGDAHQVPFRPFAIPTRTHITVRNITFVVGPDCQPDVWTVPDGCTVRMDNAKWTRDESSGNDEDYHITVYGDLYLNNTTFVNCYIHTYRIIYVGSRLQQPLYVKYLKSGDIVNGEQVLKPYNDYTFVDSDVEYIQYPGDSEWTFRLLDGVIVIWNKNESAITQVSLPDDAKVYLDTTGALRVDGVDADTPCAVVGADGQTVYSGTLAGAASRSYERGLYLVRVGTMVFKCVR